MRISDWSSDVCSSDLVVAIDYGAKDNIFRNLVKAGARVTVVPATASLDEVLGHQPAGVFLSNGPGDPAATGDYAVPVIQGLLERDVPIFGICLGHQMLRSEEHTSELQSLMRNSYAVFCLIEKRRSVDTRYNHIHLTTK